MPANPPKMSSAVHDLITRMLSTAIVYQHDYIIRQVIGGDVDLDIRDISTTSERPVQFVQNALCDSSSEAE